MQDDQQHSVPEAPETQSADVREQLHQENIDKQGDPRPASSAGAQQDSHFGAVEDEATGHSDMQVVTPPMDGAYNLVGGDEQNKQDIDVDPQDEINDAG